MNWQLKPLVTSLVSAGILTLALGTSGALAANPCAAKNPCAANKAR